jgi:NAD(P)-dependent dehydrogenase (short-subunit alcohol dehydrogenase family)
MMEMLRNNKTPHLCSSTSLIGSTAVIAGATSGVGLAAARELSLHGSDLVLLARNEEKVKAVAEELLGLTGRDQGSIRYYLADFSDLRQVRNAADRICNNEKQIDILINSAGIHSTTKIYTHEGYELTFCVNHLASFLLTHRLIPVMKKSSAARIIQVSSQGHRFGGLNTEDLSWRRRHYTGLRGYGASKTAQLLTVWELAERLQGSSVTINAMHPGEVKSAIGNNNGRLYKWYKANILWKSLKDTRISGEALHYLAADPAVEGVSGSYFNLTHSEKPAPHALDRNVGRAVWDKTLAMTDLRDEL